MIIDVNIQNKVAQCNTSGSYAVGDNNDIFVHFLFDAEWDEIEAKVAHFVWKSGSTTYEHKEPFTGDTVALPAVKDTSLLYIGVFSNNGEMRTSTPARLPVLRSTLDQMGEPEPPSDSEYQKIIALMEQAASDAATAKTTSDTAKAIAEEARQTAVDSLPYAQRAEAAAVKAEASEASARASQADAADKASEVSRQAQQVSADAVRAETAAGTASTDATRAETARAGAEASASAAKASEGAVKADADRAETARDTAVAKAGEAEQSAVRAKASEDSVAQNAQKAETARAGAEAAQTGAQTAETNAQANSTAAAQSATESQSWANKAESAAQAVAEPYQMSDTPPDDKRRFWVDPTDDTPMNRSMIQDDYQSPNRTYSSHKTDNRYGEAIEGSASGSVVAVDDVSKVEHDLDVRVERVNIFEQPYRDSSNTNNGIKWTVNDDYSISVSGTSDKQSRFYLKYHDADYAKCLNELFAEGADLFCSGGNKGIAIDFVYYQGYTYIYEQTVFVNQKMRVPTDWFEYVDVFLVVSAGATVSEAIVKPMLQRGTVATPYQPYIPDLTALTVWRYGGNLLGFKRDVGALDDNPIRTFDFSKCYVGITSNNKYNPSFIKSYDLKESSATIESSVGGFGVAYPFKSASKMTYFCKTRSNNKSAAQIAISFYKSSGEWISYISSREEQFTFTTPDNCGIIMLLVRPDVNEETTFYDTILALSDRPYTPYYPPTTSVPFPDGTVQNLTSIEGSNDLTLLSSAGSAVTLTADYHKSPAVTVSRLSDRLAALESKATNI